MQDTCILSNLENFRVKRLGEVEITSILPQYAVGTWKFHLIFIFFPLFVYRSSSAVRFVSDECNFNAYLKNHKIMLINFYNHRIAGLHMERKFTKKQDSFAFPFRISQIDSQKKTFRIVAVNHCSQVQFASE